jgi:uncharacterized tellurite resistance protein B-like protein
MFLNKLSIEQKLAFLSLAHHVAKVDGVFEDSEKAMLEYYALEMNLEHDVKNLSYPKLGNISSAALAFTGALGAVLGGVAGNALASLEQSNNKFDLNACLDLFVDAESKKILVLEILAMIYSNDEYHKEQQNVMEYILDYFDISSYLVTVYTEWAKTMISLQRQGNALIHL